MIVHGMEENEYHAHPALSSTGARMLLPEYKGSPRKFQYAQTHPRTSRAFDVGHAVHTRVLGVGGLTVTYPAEHLTPSGNPSTKAATVEWEQEQRAAGFTILSAADADRVDGIAETVLAHESARPLFEVCELREVSVFAEVEGVPSRARFDALSEPTRNGVYALDLKTTEDATKEGFERSVAKWGYDVQIAHYMDVYEASETAFIERFMIVAVEKSAPYEVAVFELPEMWLAMGRAKAQAARAIFAECTASGVWPGYTSEIQSLDAPTWLVFAHETKYDREISF